MARKTTEQFIAQAIAKHGGQYEYFGDYIDNKTKIKIRCRLEGHPTFWQTPNNHLYGRGGCQICRRAITADARRKTPAEFEAKAADLHSGKYEYFGDYIDNKTKIKIRCKTGGHGLFMSTPGNHLRTSAGGCRECKRLNAVDALRKTPADFESEATAHHAGAYEYFGDYIDSRINIKIKCKLHGLFWQIPSNHLRGGGCPKCGDIKAADKHRKSPAEFEAEAADRHSGKYEYFGDYAGVFINVKIKCPTHGLFWQRAGVHLSGSGCQKCAHATNGDRCRKSPAEFEAEAADLHSGKYEYFGDYAGLKPLIKVKCPTHGLFMQAARDHLRGSGCPKCGAVANGDAKRSNATEFEAKAADLHAGKYEYFGDYVASRDTVKIWCKAHGLFWQRASDHLSGTGCPTCGMLAGAEAWRKTPAAFEAEATGVHKGFYTYYGDYTTSTNKIKIGCPDHGTFWKLPHNHLQGGGCPKCGFEAIRRANTFTTEEFVTYATEEHGGIYSYAPTVYKGSRNKVEIVCGVHGSFWQSAASHLEGAGCRFCGGGGYDVNKEGLLYYLRVTDSAGVIRYKIGVTNRTVQARFQLGDLEIITVLGEYYHGNGANPLAKETFVLRHFAHAKYTGPDILSSGNTEIFNYDVLGLEDGGDLILAINRLQRDVIRRQVA